MPGCPKCPTLLLHPQPRDNVASLARWPAGQVLIVGDFNVAAEPRDVHPALGTFADIYGQEELAVLHSLTASYPGVGGKAAAGACRWAVGQQGGRAGMLPAPAAGTLSAAAEQGKFAG
jgi:hypothetical protein